MRKFGAAWGSMSASLAAALTLWAGPVIAAQPVDGQFGLQPSVTPVMDDIHGLHNFLLIIIIAICLFVLALLLWVMLRYNKRANPTPAKFTHSTLVEIIWTGVPIIILIAIAIPSFRLLYKADVVPEADLTIKTTAGNWNWRYAYPDHFDEGVELLAQLMPRETAAAEGLPYLLATDERMVVPVDATVRLQITADDRLHAWAIPAFGVKMDAVPGRLNETWFKAEREGLYYGQCSEICGPQHAFMPIMVEVVPQDKFDAWVACAATGEFACHTKIAGWPSGPAQTAALDAETAGAETSENGVN